MSLQEVPPILPVSLKINNTLRNYYRIFKNIFHTLSYWYNSRGVTSTSWWRHLSSRSVMTTPQLMTTSPSSPTNLSLQKRNGFSLCDVNVTSLMRTGISSVVSTKSFPTLTALPRSASVFLLLFSFEEGQSLLFSLFGRMVTYKQHTALFIGSLSMKTTFVLKLISVPLYHFIFTFFKAIFPDLTLVTCSAF